MKIPQILTLIPYNKQRSLVNITFTRLLMWTSLGLNQGPPDYESVALTN